MEYRKLGNTDIDVSVICLGTMTWGEQNSEAEGHQQLDFALERGVNFIDTAEMYSIPPRKETSGATESIIGNWDGLHKNREKIVLATKVIGPSNFMSWIRGEDNHLDRKNIMEAIDGSLKRLKTDYIDLYQLHWPDRLTNFFSQRGYKHRPDFDGTPVEETLEVLSEIQKSGKVRHFGLSNETPWGASQFLKISEKRGLPRMMSIQNPYSLLNRTYEVGLAEISIREKMGLLAYSPLAFGTLSGKYLGGKWPEGARLTKFKEYTRYLNENGIRATGKYVEIAKRHGIDPAQMALSFVNSREFVTSNIIGATNLEQLKMNIESIDLKLSEEVLSEIEAVHEMIPDPCP